jgi:hypothetical protein
VRGFISVTVAVLLLIGLGVGVMVATNNVEIPVGTVSGTVETLLPNPQNATGILIIGGTPGVVRLVQGSQVMATADFGQSLTFGTARELPGHRQLDHVRLHARSCSRDRQRHGVRDG